MKLKSVNPIRLILLAVLFLSFVAAILLAYRPVPKKDDIKTPSAQTTKDPLENEELASEIREKYSDFPIFYGVILERKISNFDKGVIIEFTLQDDLQNIVFWHYDEFEEDGWIIKEEPDIYDDETQSFTAVKENTEVEFRAEKISETDVEVQIFISK